MCNFNIVCPVKDGSCLCKKAGFISEIVRPMTISYPLPSNSNLLKNLILIISQQNEIMKSIVVQAKCILEKITDLSQSPSKSITNPPSGDEPATLNQLQKLLCGEKPQHTFELQLLCEVPNPAYKERSFSLFMQIVDTNGNKVILNENLDFSIQLFTMENPPKLLKINTSGDNILKGNIIMQGNSTLMFRKIAIREVSSHFRNGCFFLVVTPKDCSYIRPLIIDNFVVKARKMNSESIPKKNFKIQEIDRV
ncbi:hypothetical protein SteCoe_29004 [Stentor coeruleus]|uniref:Uncharacterized protein n=1 Tax=Stentor coeruleus TaxID=5963 RepID=A0A1R2B6Z5_9CILI|nr:hypothetical protein SteCoe_29004 [Stentor coeruleus]